MEKEMNFFEISEDEFYQKEMEANGVDTRARDIFGWRDSRQNELWTSASAWRASCITMFDPNRFRDI